MTYYKYAERDATSQVNWADVSKKWTDQINQVSTDRDKKRADIQKATDELTDSIINAPMGENEGINAWYSNFADQSSEYLLDANRRLKSGDLKVRDYNTIMANMTQGTERMTGLAKDYSDNYTVKMERLKNDQSQQAEVAMMELAEGYANFTNTQGIVNPTNGMISIAKNDTGQTITIPQMRAYINMQYDKYDVGAALDKQVTRLAADKQVIMSGDVKTRESQLRAWNLAKDNLLDAELADGLHVSSILTEDLGGYNVVTDATKVGENDVLFVLDPRQPSAGYRVPLYGLDLSNMTEADLDMIFSADLDDTQRSALIKQAEEQKGVARDWLNTDFDRRLGVIETPMKEPTDGGDTGLTDAQRKAIDAREQTVNAAGHWMNLAFAISPEQKTTSARALQGLKFEDEYGSKQTIVGVDPLTRNDRVVLTLRDAQGKETTVERKYADSPNAEQWVSQGNFFYEDPAAAENLVRSLQNPKREGGPAFGTMTTNIKATGRAFAEEVVDVIPYEQATVGTGKSAESAPVYFQEKSSPGNYQADASKTAAAAKAALGAMGVDASGVTHISESASDEVASALGYNEQETIRFHIPGITPESLFIPNNQAGINALADLMTMLPGLIKNREQLTVKDARTRFSNVPKFEDYNGAKFGDEMRKQFGVKGTPEKDKSTGTGTPGAASSLYNR
jgi:hypothetical protein